MDKPTSVIILGKRYSITYVDKPSEVDLFHRESLWGQIDYWTRTIRIYDEDRTREDLLHTILHEVFHGIASELHLKWLDDKEHHSELDMLALAMADVLMRNGWLSWGG